MADVAMYHVKKELQSPTPASMRASPYPFQQRTTTTTTTHTTHTSIAPLQHAVASSASSAVPMPSLHTSLANPMAFDLDFLDPSAPLAMNTGVGAASAASLHAASASHNPLDDLNLLDAQPPLLTLPGDSDASATAALRVTVTSQYASSQQFSDASSVSSAGSPDHPGLSPTTTHSHTSSFGSSPASPNSPASPLSPPTVYPTAVNAAAAAKNAAAHSRLQAPGAMWNLAAPTNSLPLPLYPLSANVSSGVPAGSHVVYTPAQANAPIKRGTSPLAVPLPQPAPRAAAASAATAKPASASAGRSPTATSAAAPKPKKAELASAAKGRRGGKKATASTGSPSASDDDDVDGAEDGGSTGGSGDDKRSKRERNKLSAMKYRKRRKVYLDGLESKVSDLNETVTSLHTENKLLKEQLDFLKNLLRNGGELPSSPTKIGDASKPMSHTANQPPILPKIPRPSQMPAHATFALFCVLACVMLCVTSPDAFFGSSFGPAGGSSIAGHGPAAPPADAVHHSRFLLQCVCPSRMAAAATTVAADGTGPGGATVTPDANPSAQTNHTECACADDAEAIDLEPVVVAPAPALCDGAASAAPGAPESAPAIPVH